MCTELCEYTSRIEAIECINNASLRTEQNRTVSLLISGHIHDIEIQCEQQNVNLQRTWYFFFSSKYKAVIQIGCSHSLFSVVSIVERGGGWEGQPPYSQCYSLSNVSSSCITRKFVVRFVFCQKTGDSSGSNSCLKMNLCQPRSVILLEITPVKQSRHPHAIPHPLAQPAPGPRRKPDKQANDRTQTSASLIVLPILYPYTFTLIHLGVCALAGCTNCII